MPPTWPPELANFFQQLLSRPSPARTISNVNLLKGQRAGTRGGPSPGNLGSWGQPADQDETLNPERGRRIHCGCSFVGDPKPSGYDPTFSFSCEPAGRNSCLAALSPTGPQCPAVAITGTLCSPSSRGRGHRLLLRRGAGAWARALPPGPISRPSRSRALVSRAPEESAGSRTLIGPIHLARMSSGKDSVFADGKNNPQ